MNWEQLPASCRYAVIGDPVGHSRSPAMQNAAFAHYGWGRPYEKIAVRPGELDEFVAWARRHLAGFNVTVPHKPAILAFCTEVSAAARLAGSVNTVTVRHGDLYGDTTDGYGLAAALRAAFGVVPAGGRFALIGAGGAARAAACHLAAHGAAEVVLINRTPERAEELKRGLLAAFPGLACSVWRPDDPDLGAVLAGCEVTIQATSLGLRAADELPVPAAALCAARAIFDTIYGRTAVGRLALEYDVPFAGGEGMLLHQGAAAFELWTGQPAPLELMRQAIGA